MTEKRSIGYYLRRPFSRWAAEQRASTIESRLSSSRLVHDIDFGVIVDNNTALRLTAYYAGIRVISENVASLPIKVVRWTDHGPVSAGEHRVTKLLRRPNAYTNGFAFRQALATALKDWGNAYAVIIRDSGGSPIELHQVSPANVSITMSSGKKYYRVTFTDTALAHLSGVYSDENMLHIMEVSLDGIKGMNPIVYNRIALEKALAQEKFAGEFYRKGGNIKGVMETDGSLGQAEYEKFCEHYAKAAQNFETPILEYGIKYKPLSVNPEAAMLLQSETMSVQDVCRILGVPPHMIAELSHATFSNIEHQTIQFVQYTIRPMVKRMETELESKLFFDDEQGEYSIEFNLSGLLRGDTAARSAFYHNAILDGYLSRNEVRELEGYAHKEGLDDMLYPTNESVVGGKDNDTTKTNE